MKKLQKTAAIFAVSTILSSSAYATDGIVAVGPKIGTQGVGLDARAPIIEKVFGRVGFNYFHIDLSSLKLKTNLTLDTKLKLITAPLMLDWHPFENSGFRISGGVAYNGNKVNFKGYATGSADFNGITYTAEDIGVVTADLTWKSKVAGLLTLGYDSSFIKDSPWSFNFEAGLMYAGAPKISANAAGPYGSAINQSLKDEISKDSKNLKQYLKYYPILSLGFKYKF